MIQKFKVRVEHPSLYKNNYRLPLKFELINEKYYVGKILDTNHSKVEIGDELITIEGSTIKKLRQKYLELISASSKQAFEG